MIEALIVVAALGQYATQFTFTMPETTIPGHSETCVPQFPIGTVESAWFGYWNWGPKLTITLHNTDQSFATAVDNTYTIRAILDDQIDSGDVVIMQDIDIPGFYWGFDLLQPDETRVLTLGVHGPGGFFDATPEDWEGTGERTLTIDYLRGIEADWRTTPMSVTRTVTDLSSIPDDESYVTVYRCFTNPDLIQVLAEWGNPGPTDIDGDGTTGLPDLLIVLNNWCEP